MRSQAKDDNGAGGHAVGAVVCLSSSDRERFFAKEHEIRELLGRLGKLRDSYLTQEAEIQKSIEHRRSEYRTMARALSESVRGGPSEKWDFNPDEMTLTRVD